MNRYIKFTLFLFIISLTSCEDVIDVPVQSAPERLVIDASLDWEKGTLGNEQSISLRTSTPFFDTTSLTAVIGASVIVTNSTTGAAFVFADQNTGSYTTSEFEPIIGNTYTLQVIQDGETYTATEVLNAVTEITDIYQDIEDGFEDDVLEVHIVFTDPEEEGNNYLFKFQKEAELLPDFELGTDEFINGNEIDWWYELEDDEDTDETEAFVSGDRLDIQFYGISDAYTDYMEILIDQIGGVGLFEATPVAVKGNCINQTNPDNFAHGYFRVTEVVRTSYTFE